MNLFPARARILLRRTFAAGILAFCILLPEASAEKTALTGGTVINPRDGRIIPNAVLVIENDTIETVAPASEARPPAAETRVIDC